MSNSIKAQITGGDDLDKLLAELPHELRQKILPKAMRANVKIVQTDARTRLPDPGYPGDKDPTISLKRWILIRIRIYDRHVVAVVGPTTAMNHAHLVEFGHAVVRRVNVMGVEVLETGYYFVPPHPYMRPAVDETDDRRHSALVTRIKKEIETFQLRVIK